MGKFIVLVKLFVISNLKNNTYIKNKIFIRNIYLQCFKTSNQNRGIHDKKSKNTFIWVYKLSDLSLVDGGPFKTKTVCAEVLKIHRSTVRIYLDTRKPYKNELIFSSTSLSKEELSKYAVPLKVWLVITGELLGDGHINYDPLKAPGINGRLEFTFSSKILHYVKYLKFDVLNSICTQSEPTPWPNPITTGQEPTQYWFSSKRLINFNQLHSTWYKQIKGQYIKILPLNIEELLTPIGLAHWIMGDGYFSTYTVKLCTDNFTKEEVVVLTKVLANKFGIDSTINRRSNSKGTIVWRIRISKSSMDKLILLVSPHMIPEMLYKLGIKKQD